MIYLVSNQTELNPSEAYERASIQDVLSYFKEHEHIGVDTETGGFDPYTVPLLMIQLGDRINQYVIDATTVPIKALKPLLEEKILIMHNAKFDLRFLYQQGIIPKHIYDTFLAERVLSTGINSHRKGLEPVVQRHVDPNIHMDKSVRTKIKLDTRSILYAADDVKYLDDVRVAQDKLLTQENLQHTLALDNEFVRVLAYIEHCGIFLDVPKWTAKAQEDLQAKAETQRACDEWIVENMDGTKWVNSFGDLFNPNPTSLVQWSSPKQCVDLFEGLGVDVVVYEKGVKKKSVDSKVLEPQIDKSPLVSLYLKYKEKEKLCSTYGMGFLKQINPITQRIHTQFTQIIKFVTYVRNSIWKNSVNSKKSIRLRINIFNLGNFEPRLIVI